MNYNRASYKEMMTSIKEYERQQQALEARLNDLLEEQALFKDNTFSYADEAREVYGELIKIKQYKESLIVTTSQIKAKRDKRKLKSKQKEKPIKK